MLSPSQLERAPQAYRRGYYDGYYGRPNQAEIASDDYRDGTFRGGDYVKGYAAGANDLHWSQKRSRRDTCECGRINCAFPECPANSQHAWPWEPAS